MTGVQTCALPICAPRPPQVAVARCLPELAGWRAENRLEIDYRRRALIDIMAEIPDWEIETIGAYFSYIKHPYPNRSSVEVAKILAEERGVVCLPGAFFGEAQDAYLRFAFANVTSNELKALVDRLVF